MQLPPSQGHTAILVVVDRLTKMAHFIPTKDEVNAEEIVKLLLSKVFSLHGLPDDIVSDRGSVFTSHFTRSVMTGLGITQNISTAFHPQTDGQTERTNATLEQYLRCFLNYQQDNWIDFLPMAEFCYNNTVHSSTKHTPFFALTGTHPRFSIHIPRTAAATPYERERIQHLKEIQEELKFHIKSAQEIQERYYNQHVLTQPSFAPGDRVWLVRTNIKTTRPSAKLDNLKIGPFEIVKLVGTRSYELKLPASMSRIHPVFHVSLLERYYGNTISGRVPPPPPPIEIDGEIEYEVEAIVDSRIFRKRLQYRVQWKGYNELTWEPHNHVDNCPDLIQEFHAKYPSKPGPDLSLSGIAPKREGCHESLGSTLVDLRVISADSWDDSAEAIEQWLDAWVAVDIPRSRNIPTVESDPGDQVVPVLNQSRPHPDRAVPDQSQVELDQDPSRTQTQLSGLTLHGFGSSSA